MARPIMAAAALLGAALVWVAPAGAPLLGASGTRATPEDFSYGALQARGPRPLLTILMDYSDLRFSARHTPTYYRDVLFATAGGRLIGSAAGRGSVFDEISDGQFWYENAGVLGPFQHPDDPATTVDESTFECAYGRAPGCAPGQLQRTRAIQAAAASGFDFARYDTDRDGCVRTDELTILMFFAERGEVRVGASTRGPEIVRVGSSLSTCTLTIGAGDSVSAATVSHELLHTLGLVDVYGGSANNYPYSLMGPTITPRADDLYELHLDPYNKLRLGWVRPQVLTFSDTGCYRLRAAELTPTGTPKSYLIHDPARGTQEYFMVEHRLPSTFNYDGDPWLRGAFSVPDQGLALWYVKATASGQLLIVPNIAGTEFSDRSLYVIPAGRGLPGKPSATGGLWDRDDGVARPLWLNLDGTSRGTPSGLELRVRTDVSRAEITFSIGSVATCDPLPPVSGPPPATLLPEIDDGPCKVLRSQSVCTLTSPSFVAVRRIPVNVAPGKTFTVSWTATARKSDGRLAITDTLPKGFQALGKLGPFELVKGKPVTRTYRVRSSGGVGRYRFSAVGAFRPQGAKKPTRATLRAVALLYSPTAVSAHPFRPDPPPPPPPPLPDLVVTAVSGNGALVRNQGEAAAGAFVVRFQGEVTRNASVNGLASGATVFVPIPAGVCTKPASPLTVIADADGSVRESNEANNSRTGTC